MKPYLLLAAILFTPTSLLADSLILKAREKSYEVVSHQGVRVSQDCLKTLCDALKPALKQVPPKPKKSFIGNPAASFCEIQGARYEIAKRASGDEDGLCVFKDQSYILGWDYFKRNEAKAKR